MVPPNLLSRIVRAALQEDIGPGDLTTRAVIPSPVRARGTVTAGQPLVVAGLEAARMAFMALDPAADIHLETADGARLDSGGTLMVVEGDAASMLAAERTALNFLGRLSGIATFTRRCVDQAAGTGASILDTRKTTPGMRLLEKEAVRLGGGVNHRFGLYDAILIKDNHLAVVARAALPASLPCPGAVGEAVRRAREFHGPDAPIEVEVEDLAGLDEALAAGADLVLLDNMPVEMVARAVARLRSSGSSAELEVSGGITLENLASFARTGVTRISIGALTHSAPSADVSFALCPL